MIQKYFFLILMLVPCIASSINQVDSIISDLKIKNEILQDSVAYLLKQTSEMQKQLKHLMSTYHPSEKKIADLEKMINISTQKFNLLLPWKNEIDSKVNRFKSAVNMTVLNQRLQPMNFEIEKLKNSLKTFSQKEDAVQLTLKRQIAQMGHLFKEFKEVKDKLPSIEKGIKYLDMNLEATSQKLELAVNALRKKDDDHEKYHKTIDDEIKNINANIDLFRVILRKLNTNKNVNPPSI